MAVEAGCQPKIKMFVDIFKIILASIFFLIIFVASEVMHRRLRVKAEITRKLAHILSAIILVFLPFFMSMVDISIIALMFIIVLLISAKLKIFKSIHNVKRKTYGEILFPFGVLVVLIFSNSTLIFQLAMLILGFSDTAAELIGKQFGKKKFLSNNSTVAGSLAFFSVTIIILSFFNNIGLNFADKIIIGIALTTVEALSNYGFDNLLIPTCLSALIYLSR